MRKFIAYIILTFCGLLVLSNATFQSRNYKSNNKPVKVISSRTMSLENRYDNLKTSGVFRDNILLTIHYMKGTIKPHEPVKWAQVKQPFQYNLTLKPKDSFAFHNALLPEYEKTTIKTPGVRFSGAEGFLSSGTLFGDGVCHLASLINWAAQDAGLEVTSLVNHDFANIPEVPRKYGTSIYAGSGDANNDARQNLYVKNSLKHPVVLNFVYDGTNLTISVIKASGFLAKQ